MTPRYFTRSDPEGFRVTDIWTGQPATLALTPQAGLSKYTDHTAALLNEASMERDAAAS